MIYWSSTRNICTSCMSCAKQVVRPVVTVARLVACQEIDYSLLEPFIRDNGKVVGSGDFKVATVISCVC